MPARPHLRTLRLLAGLMAYWGFLDSLNSSAAPFLAQEFGLDDVGITRLFGWMSVGAVGTVALARWADRTGRRRVLLATVFVLGPLALASAAAPALWILLVLQVGVWALKGLLQVLIPVMVTEVAPVEDRATGQGWIGMAGALGAGLTFIIVPAVASLPGGWRWAWVLAAGGLLFLPFLRRALPESPHYERVSAESDEVVGPRVLLESRYRRRSLAGFAVALLHPMAIASTMSWYVYFPVQHLGLDPWIATLSVLVGGGVSLVGFPLGGMLSERWGRRPTFGISSALYALATWAYFEVDAEWSWPLAGLIPALCAMTLLNATTATPLRAALTELFPTALRATFSGAIALAAGVGAVAGYFACSWLTGWLGGLPAAATALGLVMPLAGLVFVGLLPETRGVALEDEDAALAEARRRGR